MENDAAAQLAAIADARSAVADRLITPWWYHPALGLALAAYVIGLSYGNTLTRIGVVLLFLGFCAILAHVYRRMTGVWVSGLSAGRASRWATALGTLLAVIVGAGMLIGTFTDARRPVWALAALGFIATVVLGRRFDAALRAQLRAGA
jgi:putative Mn2+ efflux pump MntP